jgi:dihydrofolate reductase
MRATDARGDPMRRVCFSAAVSVDGFIAGPQGEHDWIVMDPDIDFGALMARFDTVLLGRKTYEASRDRQPGGMPGVATYVLSRTLRQEDCPGVTVCTDPQQTIAALRTKKGKDMWLFGGGELLRSFMRLRLVDSIELTVIPVLLGEGIPLLPGSIAHPRLRLVSHKVYPKTGTVALAYAPA